MINPSAWDSAPKRTFSSNEITPARVELAFNGTNKALAIKPGRVVFASKQERISQNRNRLIKEFLNSGKFKNVSNVYTEAIPMDSVGPAWEVYSHGEPNLNGTESCAKFRLRCKNSEGTDQECNRGKCIIGTINKVRNNKWIYISEATYGGFRYTTHVGENDGVINLKSLVRGRALTLDTPESISITSPASPKATIYTPLLGDSSQADFLDSLVFTQDSRLSSVVNPPTSPTTGVRTRKEIHISRVGEEFSRSSGAGSVSNALYSPAYLPELREFYKSRFESLRSVWYTRVSDALNSNSSTTGYDFLSSAYEELQELFSIPLFEISSDFVSSTLDIRKDKISRPVYSRMPGVAEAYRNDPSLGEDTPAQWLVSGVDDFLSAKKDQIANFYYNYLDPSTCPSAWLDWIAQHVGFTGSLWDSSWARHIKVALIKNSLGWWENEVSAQLSERENITVLTKKGETLAEFPFNTDPLWTTDPAEENIQNVIFDRIDTITESDIYRYTLGIYNTETSTRELQFTNSVKIDSAKWTGLIQSKGSIMCVAFLCSVFGLKAFSLNELNPTTLRPVQGLRAQEQNSPTLLPYYCFPLQVGTQDDLEIKNYENQLVVGQSLIHDENQSKVIVFRMPFYYNRDGVHWKAAEYIAKNWVPTHMNARVQYPYLCADLWKVGDMFFEIDAPP